MKTKLTFLFLMLTVFMGYAQNNIKISGRVLDKSSNEAVPYSTVTIKKGEEIVTGGMTSDNGSFSISVPSGNYLVEIQFIGYKKFNKDIQATSNTDLNVIYLEAESTTLEGVNIIAEQSTIEQKIDRKVINVGKDLSTAGATASEIMNNIPSVFVDQDGKISLRGNENVRILIDGKPTNMSAEQLLKQIPATSIKTIELITNPSAKYSPEGMSGIINITLHKNMADGFNGSFDTGINIAKHTKSNNSLNLNFRKGKFNFYGNASYSEGKSTNQGRMFREDLASPTTIDMLSNNKNFLYKLGVDYYINDKNTLSFYTNQSTNKNDIDLELSTTYPRGEFDNIAQNTNYDAKNTFRTYNLAYKHLFEKKGHTLDVEANLNKNKNSNDGDYNTTIGNNLNPYLYKDGNNDKNDLTTINVDYVNPIDDKSKLELGAEARISRANNQFGSNNPLIPSNQQNIHNKYDQDIYSAYATFGQKYGKFNYQVGARLESYKVESKLDGKTTFKDDYVTLYPSVYLGYALTDNDMFNLSYSRRVDRPSIAQTNPVRQFSTPLMTMVGNPELEPQFTNSVELNYTRMFAKRSSITGGVYYRRINHEINHVIYDDPENDNPNALLMTFDNYKANNAYGFEVSANIIVSSWWNMQPSVDFSNIKQTGFVSMLNSNGQMDFVQRSISAAAFNARLNSNFTATKNLRFNLFGFFRGGVDGITSNSKDMYKIDAGARYSLLKNTLSISARFNDIFNTMAYKFTTQYPYPSSGQFTWESRAVYIGATYTFGGGKGRALQRKQRDTNTKQSGGSGGLF